MSESERAVRAYADGNGLPWIVELDLLEDLLHLQARFDDGVLCHQATLACGLVTILLRETVLLEQVELLLRHHRSVCRECMTHNDEAVRGSKCRSAGSAQVPIPGAKRLPAAEWR